MSLYPLAGASKADARELCSTLWSWPYCALCDRRGRCTDASCPWRQTPRLDKYFEYYREITSLYYPDARPGRPVALRSHQDLSSMIQRLKSNPRLTKAQLAAEMFPGKEDASPSAADIDNAMNLAVCVMLMVDCSTDAQSVSNIELARGRVTWQNDQTLTEFIASVFRLPDSNTAVDVTDERIRAWGTGLTAARLKKRAGLKFKATDDLRNHLNLSKERDVVEIFHYTAFLKEHLRLTKNKPHSMTLEESLSCGALPRAIALEVLDSIQQILFPLAEPSSHNLLLSLLSSASFDPDIMYWESSDIRRDNEKGCVPFVHFGARLADLYEELENPRPRNWIEQWVEDKSGARYVMMATLGGIAIAIMLGIASLGVTCFGVWIAWMQWQHPVGQQFS